MLTVWGRSSSSNVKALMWCLAELDLPVQRHNIGGRFGGTNSTQFTALNPNQTIPVLQDGTGPPIWKTGAILRYLCSKYAKPPFWPTEIEHQSQVDQWAEWAKINIALSFTGPVFWRVIRTAAAEHNQPAIRAAVTTLEHKLAIAEAQLGRNKFLAGNSFCLADVQFGHILYRYYNIEITRKALPNLARYYGGLTQRQAYRDHVMLSYDDLRVS